MLNHKKEVGMPRFAILRLSPSTVFVLGAFLLTNCSLNGRLYNLSTGEQLTAKFTYSGSGRGQIQLTSPGGESFNGEYVTVAGGSMAWGTIFSSVYTPGGSAFGSASAVGGSIENMQKGSAIVTGNKGTVIQCEYVTSAYSAQGYGACQDNKGNHYKLMF
jgi:hypothetical protein